jgi:hypothetical protein
MAVTNKWSKAFWVDLAERVGSTFVGALLALVTTASSTPIEWDNPAYFWPILGVPVLVSLLKGLAANFKDPESGASIVDAPPGPVLEEGATDILYAAGAALVLLAVVLLVTTLLKAFVVSWVVIIVIAVVGLFLLFWRAGGVHRL